jgi:hypothetical protein
LASNASRSAARLRLLSVPILGTHVTLTDKAVILARQLCDIGFFEETGDKVDPWFWVPFLYRDALDLIQGAAE